MDSCSTNPCYDAFSGGFSFVTNVTEVEEPKTFRVASTKSEWQLAMQEDYNALKT